MPTPPPANPLPVWVMTANTTTALRKVCDDYQVTARTLLLVCATDQPAAMIRAAAHYGVPRPSGSIDPLTQAYADSLCQFARQHPHTLLARSGTGQPETVPDEQTGEPVVPWANLGPLRLSGR